jgi:hypothetical protein
MSDGAIVSIVSVVCIIGLPILWGVLSSVAAEWRKARVAEQIAVLKKDMIERGFSAGEIVRVIEAGAELEDKIAGKTPQPACRA